jgi:hypothetical protein
LNYLLTVCRMAINNVAEPNATRKDEVLLFLSAIYPSVDTSAMQKIVDALERAEVGFYNDDFDVVALINQWIDDNPT